MQDGFCDDEANIKACNYDGFDCCRNDSNYGFCNVCYCKNPDNIQHPVITTTMAPCPDTDLINNGICDYDIKDIHDCYFDGKDCSMTLK